MDKIYDQEFLARLERLMIKTRRIKAGINSGERRSPNKGYSVEFADFRTYSSGDDVRYIDWNSYARTDKLFLKLFVEEQDLTVNIFVDTSKSMIFPHNSKAILAQQLAGALSYLTLSSYDQLSISSLSDVLSSYLPPLRGISSVTKAWQFLEGLNFFGRTDLTTALRQFGRYSRRPGVSIVISDFLSDNDFYDGLRFLQYLKQDVILLQILSSEEINPLIYGNWRLKDGETGEIREIEVNTALLQEYKKKLNAYREEIKGFCMQRGISYLMVSSDESFEDIILRRFPAAGLIK